MGFCVEADDLREGRVPAAPDHHPLEEPGKEESASSLPPYSPGGLALCECLMHSNAAPAAVILWRVPTAACRFSRYKDVTCGLIHYKVQSPRQKALLRLTLEYGSCQCSSSACVVAA